MKPTTASLLALPAFITALALHLNAHAAWEPLGPHQAGARHHVNPETLQAVGDYRRIWTVLDFERPDAKGNQSRLIRVEYDCKEPRLRWLQSNDYSGPMATGDAPALFQMDGGWSGVQPGTPQDTWRTAVCSMNLPPPSQGFIGR